MASVTNFLKELRRRNVFKAGAAYVIMAWLIIQVRNQQIEVSKSVDSVQFRSIDLSRNKAGQTI